MIWTFEMCAGIRRRLAEADLDYDAYDPEVVARIDRATGRPFRFGRAPGMGVLS